MTVVSESFRSQGEVRYADVFMRGGSAPLPPLDRLTVVEVGPFRHGISFGLHTVRTVRHGQRTV